MPRRTHEHVSPQDMQRFLELRLSLAEYKKLLRKLMTRCPTCLETAREALDQAGPPGIETEAAGTPLKLDD